MKFIKTLVLPALLFVTVLVSCKKDDTTTPATTTYPIQGLWVGSAVVSGSSLAYNISVKPDGTILTDNKPGGVQHYSAGTWSLSGTTFTATFTCLYGSSGSIGLVQSCTLIWDNTGKLNGTFQNVSGGPAASGTFSFTRVN